MKKEDEKLKAWRTAWERRCPSCGATPLTPCRDSSGINLNPEASGLPILHLNR
jgi:hypothetical protein